MYSAAVTPRSGGYGNVTETYIRRSKIPSRIYAKHQYRQESECGSTVVIHIPTEKYKYMVITESDTTLQEYYITRKYKSTIHEEVYITKTERCSRATRGTSRANHTPITLRSVFPTPSQSRTNIAWTQNQREKVTNDLTRFSNLPIVGPKAHHSSFDDDQLM